MIPSLGFLPIFRRIVDVVRAAGRCIGIVVGGKEGTGCARGRNPRLLRLWCCGFVFGGLGSAEGGE